MSKTMQVWIGNESLVTESCYLCGMVFAMPKRFRQLCLDNGPAQTFFCPLGHSQIYKESEADKLRKQLKEEQDRHWSRERHLEDQREAAERSARAHKGQVTKIKNRVGRGVCPCCNRSFEDLKRHMASEHPDFVEEKHDD